MFGKGDLVVYGRTGLCEIVDVTTIEMNGIPQDKLYYILNPYRGKGGRIFTPVDNEKVVMRSVISRNEAMALLEQIPNIDELWISSEKQREEAYKESMRSCECEDWVKVLKTLYQRMKKRMAQGKKITSTDERYLKMAEGNLYAELSIALGVPEKDMEAFIRDYLTKEHTEAAETVES